MTDNIIQKATKFSNELEHTSPTYDKETILPLTLRFLEEELNETKDAVNIQDDEEIADGFGDCAFLALNGIYKLFRAKGENHKDATQHVITVMDRICQANLGKIHPDGTVQYKEGKVQKPVGWRAPSYTDLFEKVS